MPRGVKKIYQQCGAKNRAEQGHCQRPAGEGTDHPGTGHCHWHERSALTLEDPKLLAVRMGISPPVTERELLEMETK
jgi:hypothetical protein